MASLFRPSVLLLVSCLALACDDSEPRVASVPLPCDIRDEICRLSIFRETVRVRAQRGAKQPPTRIITRQTFAMEEGGELEEQPMASRESQTFEQSLKLLHFLPEDSSFGGEAMESEVGGVAAYYDPEARAVTIIEDSVADDIEEGTNTLAHEYVHALQDQQQGLERLTKSARTTDEIMALRAYFEGEASVLADVVLARALDVPYEFEAARLYFGRFLSNVLLAVENSDAPLNMGILVLPYPIGGLPLSEAYSAGGIRSVQALYRNRPKTLAGWNDVARASLLPVLPNCLTPDPPTGYETPGADSLGTTALIALYTRIGLTGDDAFDAARAWTGDAFAMFAPKEGPVTAALAWRIRMRDAAAASELRELIAASTLDVQAELIANEVVITASTAPGLLASWTGRNACASNKSKGELKSVVPQAARFFQRLHAPLR